MGFLRNCSLIIFAAALLSSCTGKVVCPAYSSYFMLDEDYRDKHFAYFGEDSLPNSNVKDVEKTWYGTIAQPKLFAFYRKNESLKTVPMELVFANVPDSLAFAGDELMYAEMDIVDSTRFEEEGPANKWNWNVEQEYYFRRIKDMIITEEDLEQGKADQKAASEPTVEGEEGATKKKGFFSKLFGKKDKSGQDESEGDSVEEGEESPKKQKAPKEKKEKPPKEKKKKEKKSLFGKKKGDDQAEPQEPEKKSDDEDEGEGF